MTNDEILDMKPGAEMDEKIGKAFTVTPRIKWYAMNAAETAYYIDFESKKDAYAWHDQKTKKYPSSQYVADGGHIVRREIHKHYSTDISAAMDIVEQFDFYKVEKVSGYGETCYKVGSYP